MTKAEKRAIGQRATDLQWKRNDVARELEEANEELWRVQMRVGAIKARLLEIDELIGFFKEIKVYADEQEGT